VERIIEELSVEIKIRPSCQYWMSCFFLPIFGNKTAGLPYFCAVLDELSKRSQKVVMFGHYDCGLKIDSSLFYLVDTKLLMSSSSGSGERACFEPPKRSQILNLYMGNLLEVKKRLECFLLIDVITINERS